MEIIREVLEIPGVSGVHVMAYRQEDLVAEVEEEVDLLTRRWAPEPRPTAERQELGVQR